MDRQRCGALMPAIAEVCRVRGAKPCLLVHTHGEVCSTFTCVWLWFDMCKQDNWYTRVSVQFAREERFSNCPEDQCSIDSKLRYRFYRSRIVQGKQQDLAGQGQVGW